MVKYWSKNKRVTETERKKEVTEEKIFTHNHELMT